jgi:hypothetical protein
MMAFMAFLSGFVLNPFFLKVNDVQAQLPDCRQSAQGIKPSSPIVEKR